MTQRHSSIRHSSPNFSDGNKGNLPKTERREPRWLVPCGERRPRFNCFCARRDFVPGWQWHSLRRRSVRHRSSRSTELKLESEHCALPQSDMLSRERGEASEGDFSFSKTKHSMCEQCLNLAAKNYSTELEPKGCLRKESDRSRKMLLRGDAAMSFSPVESCAH